MNKNIDYSVLEVNHEIKKENFVKENESSDEISFNVKPVSYLKDSLIKFSKNKASLIAFIIFILISLYAIFATALSPFERIDKRAYNVDGMRINEVLPKAFEDTGFWDGTDIRTVNDVTYNIYKNYETKSPIKEDFGLKELTKDELII